jgi:hypothetical protein
LIQGLSFQDCRVVISNVDSQLSREEGVIVQVLGEMSNRGLPSQKFVQTFFLAKQPKGYYILNDIFRFLREELDEEAEDEAEDEGTGNEQEEVLRSKPANVEEGTKVIYNADVSKLARGASPEKANSKSPGRPKPVESTPVAPPSSQSKPNRSSGASKPKSRETSPKRGDNKAPAANGLAPPVQRTTSPTPATQSGVSGANSSAAPKAPNTWARIASATASANAAKESSTAAPVASEQSNVSPTSSTSSARPASPSKKDDVNNQKPREPVSQPPAQANRSAQPQAIDARANQLDVSTSVFIKLIHQGTSTNAVNLTEEEIRSAYVDLKFIRVEVGSRGAVCFLSSQEEAASAVGKRARIGDRETVVEVRRYMGNQPPGKMRGGYRGRGDYNPRYHHHVHHQHHQNQADGANNTSNARPGSASGNVRGGRGGSRGGRGGSMPSNSRNQSD